MRNLVNLIDVPREKRKKAKVRRQEEEEEEKKQEISSPEGQLMSILSIDGEPEISA